MNSKYQVVALTDYQMVKPNLAKVVLTCSRFMEKQDLVAKLQDRLQHKATPILSSFQWLDEDQTAAVGYVTVAREVRALENDSVSANFRVVEKASNLYMDEADKSLWELKEGASGKFLARKGVDDLTALIEQCRVAHRAGMPRCSQVSASFAQTHDFVGYVWASKYQSSVDYGFVLGKEGSKLKVLSYATRAIETVEEDQTFAAVECKDMPRPTKAQAKIYLQNQGKVQAALATDPKLSAEDYYRLAYSYAPDYVEKIIQQIQQQAAI